MVSEARTPRRLIQRMKSAITTGAPASKRATSFFGALPSSEISTVRAASTAKTAIDHLCVLAGQLRRLLQVGNTDQLKRT
jgi:hypothetical protein